MTDLNHPEYLLKILLLLQKYNACFVLLWALLVVRDQRNETNCSCHEPPCLLRNFVSIMVVFKSQLWNSEWLIFCQAKHILITYEKHWSVEISEKWPSEDDSEVAQCNWPYHTQPFLPPFFTWNTFQVHNCAKSEGYKTTDVSCHRPNNILAILRFI